jgi:hypothetical protein
MTNKSGIELCKQAFERLKAGKPNDQRLIGKLITPSLVSREAGFDNGYLKPLRPAHRSLVDEINQYKEKAQAGSFKSQIAALESKVKKLTIEKNEYKKERDNGLIRELQLFKELSKLQKMLNDNVISLNNK